MAIAVRVGEPGDAEALAHLHVEVWRQTYRDMATPEAYDRLGVRERLPYWQTALASPEDGVGVFVGQTGDEITGVVSFGPPRDVAMAGAIEIKHLYVATSAQGTGMGRALMEAAFAGVRSSGHDEAALAVVEENAAARAFYRHLGGRETGRFVDPGPLWRSSNIVVRWMLK